MFKSTFKQLHNYTWTGLCEDFYLENFILCYAVTRTCVFSKEPILQNLY